MGRGRTGEGKWEWQSRLGSMADANQLHIRGIRNICMEGSVGPLGKHTYQTACRLANVSNVVAEEV